MFCNACGNEVNPDEKFCSRCGKTTGAAITSGPRNRVRQHIYSLAVLWIIYSAYRVIVRALLLIPASSVLGKILQAPLFMDMPFGFHGILGSMLGFVAAVTLIKSVAGIAVGIGLLRRSPWARVLALVLGFYSLIHPLLGTILGIYTLWVLLPQGSAEQYEALTQKTVTA